MKLILAISLLVLAINGQFLMNKLGNERNLGFIPDQEVKDFFISLE